MGHQVICVTKGVFKSDELYQVYCQAQHNEQMGGMNWPCDMVGIITFISTKYPLTQQKGRYVHHKTVLFGKARAESAIMPGLCYY